MYEYIGFSRIIGDCEVVKEVFSIMTENSTDLQNYVANHREDLHYALKQGDRWARSIVIAALVAAGDAEVELAIQELKATQQKNSS